MSADVDLIDQQKLCLWTFVQSCWYYVILHSVLKKIKAIKHEIRVKQSTIKR